MRKIFSFDTLTFVLSFLGAFFIIYRKLPIANLQQISGVLLVVLLILLNLLSSNKSISRAVKLLFLLLSSFFVEILILSTGNFYSPFLILIHIYSLGVSFLISLGAALVFLLLSTSILILNIYLTPQLLFQFTEDPGSTLLYLTSFVVIIPLSLLVSRYYRLKDAVLAVMNREAKLSSARQESLFSGVNELVIVTDAELNIVSANTSVERLLKLGDTEIVGKNLLDVLILKDDESVTATKQSLSIDRIFIEKAARVVNGYYLFNKSNNRMSKVVIQIRPIADLNGEVNQLVFVLTDPQSIIDDQGHVNLELARKKQKELARNLKRLLQEAKLAGLNYEVNLFDKNEDDLLNAYELADHQIKEKISFEDIALICYERVEYKESFAGSLRVRLRFILPEREVGEQAIINAKRGNNLNHEFFTNSSFSSPLDARWFKLLVDKLIDLAILLSSDIPGSTVEVTTLHQNSVLVVIISCGINNVLSAEDQRELFKEYYGNLVTKTNLKLGSGLEGFIAKNVATQLNWPLSVKFDVVNKRLTFQVEIKRNPRS